MRRFLLSTALLALLPAAASAITFTFPVKCEMNRTCFIMKLVDHDPTPEVKDYRCGHLSDNGHDGTDIRLQSVKEMEAGVDVVAAADGTVKNVRDKLKDISVKEYDASVIKGYECGNGVVLEHADGYSTQYCHMKMGSIKVKEGDAVKAGEPLGQVGMSGMAEVPHLHFILRQQGTVIDPFTSRGMNSPCGRSGVSLWDDATKKFTDYKRTQVVSTGFSAEEPTVEGILAGKYREETLPKDAPVIYYWVYGAGLSPEQDVRIDMKGPGGKTLARTTANTEKYQLWFLRFIGKKLKDTAWTPGDYAGSFTVTGFKDGLPLIEVESAAKAKIAE